MNTDTPLGRAFAALEILGAQPGVTGAELGVKLGVSPRAVRRAVASLRDAGFGISSTPGLAGGYRLERGKRMPLILTDDELTCLAMVLVEAPGTPADESTRSVTRKILRSITPTAAAPAMAVLDTAATMPPTVPTKPAPATVLDLARAIADHVRIEIQYQAAGDSSGSTRLVEPWGLVVRHHRWYLLARDVQPGQTRTYRIDRIGTVVATSERFTPPAGLDPLAEFENHLRTSWRHPTRVRIHAPVAEVRHWVPFTMGELREAGPDTCQLTGRTNNCTAYLMDLLRLPFEFTIEGGDELSHTAHRLSERLVTASQPGSR